MKDLINRTWGSARSLTAADAKLIPASDLPSLDAALQAAGLLESYVAAGRPKFAAFRRWWHQTTGMEPVPGSSLYFPKPLSK
jgi:hypothetical protein